MEQQKHILMTADKDIGNKIGKLSKWCEDTSPSDFSSNIFNMIMKSLQGGQTDESDGSDESNNIIKK